MEGKAVLVRKAKVAEEDGEGLRHRGTDAGRRAHELSSSPNASVRRASNR